jgi:hypothetical protein
MENIRVMCFLAFLACCKLIQAGKKSLWASKSQKLWFVKSNYRMNAKRFAWVFFFIICIHVMGSNTRHIIQNHHAKQAKAVMQGHKVEGKKGGRVL